MSQSPHKNALTLVASPELRVTTNEITKLQDVAVQQVAAISLMETRAAAGAILAGLTLHRVKASLAHGEFGKWLEQMSTNVDISKGSNSHRGGNLPKIKRAQVNYYMRLALAFLEKAKVAKPDLLALPGDQTELSIEGTSGPARRFMEKLAGFVGELSLNELLIKYGIKGVGLKTELEAGESAKPEGEDIAAFAAKTAMDWRRMFTDRVKIAQLPPETLRLLDQEITDGYSQFKRLIAEALGSKQS